MTYLDDHPLSGAFLANKLDRLADQIADQGEEMLQMAGLDIPSRAVSVILLLKDGGAFSVADIASKLQQPHQLVTQRLELLLDADLVERKKDPSDGRRKILVLTAKGESQLAQLQISLSDAAYAFAILSKEVDCDLAAVVMRAIHALEQKSLTERISHLKSSDSQI